MKEERTRYKTTVRQRGEKNHTSDIVKRVQPTSLSSQKFLMSRRRNPVGNTQVYSTKVSPFKPMGGGFKQNLNIEMSPKRIRQEVAAAREQQSRSNSIFGYRQSIHKSNNTIAMIAESPVDESAIGFNIETAALNVKPNSKVDDSNNVSDN